MLEKQQQAARKSTLDTEVDRLKRFSVYIENYTFTSKLGRSKLKEALDLRLETLGLPGGMDKLKAMDEARIAEIERRNKASFKVAVMTNLIEKTGIPVDYRCANFITNSEGSPIQRVLGNEKSLHHAAKLAEVWTPGMKGLVLRGFGTGVGKTYPLCAVAVALHNKHKIVRFTTMSRLLDRFRATFNDSEGSETSEAVFDDIAVNADLLVLDELGGESIKSDDRGNWARDKILGIIDYRSTNKLTTCFTTNCTHGQLEKLYNARIMSRILALAVWLEVDAPDFRQSVVDPFDD